MEEITIPGYKTLQLSQLVLDFNGTLACDGRLLEGVAERLNALAPEMKIHVVTADTFGTVRQQLAEIPCDVVVLPVENQDTAKRDFVGQLDADATVAVGNGRNDRLMLKAAALGIAVVQEEGAAVETVIAADIVCPDILSALDLLDHPKRLIATLRS